MCNKGAGKVGDLVHLDSIWQRLNFDQLKLSRSKVGILLLWSREVATTHCKTVGLGSCKLTTHLKICWQLTGV